MITHRQTAIHAMAGGTETKRRASVSSLYSIKSVHKPDSFPSSSCCSFTTAPTIYHHQCSLPPCLPHSPHRLQGTPSPLFLLFSALFFSALFFSALFFLALAQLHSLFTTPIFNIFVSPMPWSTFYSLHSLARCAKQQIVQFIWLRTC